MKKEFDEGFRARKAGRQDVTTVGGLRPHRDGGGPIGWPALGRAVTPHSRPAVARWVDDRPPTYVAPTDPPWNHDGAVGGQERVVVTRVAIGRVHIFPPMLHPSTLAPRWGVTLNLGTESAPAPTPRPSGDRQGIAALIDQLEVTPMHRHVESLIPSPLPKAYNRPSTVPARDPLQRSTQNIKS